MSPQGPEGEKPGGFDYDVVVIGSGFGGAVAALRFAEAGHRVAVLERGDWVRRQAQPVGPKQLWRPKRGWFGLHDIRHRGARVTPWLGAGVGGGSHVFAGTLKRCETFDGFPSAIREEDMTGYFERAERVMEVRPHPREDAPVATQRLLAAGARLEQEAPELVEERGVVPIAMQFAREGLAPGSVMANAHGAEQRAHHPQEQALLGGDVGSKNTLDLNYLHLARRHGAEIRALTEVDRIDPLPITGYRVHFRRWTRNRSERTEGSLSARRVVLAAGAIGSTEILLRNRDVHGTLPHLSSALGRRYTTNGNYLNGLVAFPGAALAWLAFAALVIGLWLESPVVALAAAAMYYGLLLRAGRPLGCDLGAVNSEYLRLKGRPGGQGSVYLEGGRYPTPLRFLAAATMSALGVFRPSRYRWIVRIGRLLAWIPPFGALARSWPLPLLQMGRDDTVGIMRLDHRGELTIDFDVTANEAYYEHLNAMGRRLARAAGATWVPNFIHALTKRLSVPHNQGGAPMGESATHGVVDHAGRVFGYRDLMVLDGAIIPRSPGPNPALTIMAVAERAAAIAIAQVDATGSISPELEAAPAPLASAS